MPVLVGNRCELLRQWVLCEARDRVLSQPPHYERYRFNHAVPLAMDGVTDYKAGAVVGLQACHAISVGN